MVVVIDHKSYFLVPPYCKFSKIISPLRSIPTTLTKLDTAEFIQLVEYLTSSGGLDPEFLSARNLFRTETESITLDL